MSDLDDAIARLDRLIVGWPEEDRNAWKLVRAQARRTRRISSTSLPAVGEAAQHITSARDHAARAMEALGGVFGREPDDEPGDR